MDQLAFEPLIWMDYRVAVLFAVLVPLVLLIWAFTVQAGTAQHLLSIYWRVASLLGITVYLMIASLPVSFLSALAARILIPLSLWFWVDLNEELADLPQKNLRLALLSWRWTMTVYCGLGAIAQIISLPCAFKSATDITATPLCRTWLEPTWLYREYFHANTNPSFLGFLGILGLVFYVLCLGYFLVFRLGRQGRSAAAR